MPEDGTPTTLDLDEALKQDTVESLKREKSEIQEKLDASDAKECPSCRATFERGTGVTDDPKGEKKPAAKKPAAKKPAVKDEPTDEPKAVPEVEVDEGFGFFD